MVFFSIHHSLLICFLLLYVEQSQCQSLSALRLFQWREAARELFDHAMDGYMTYAYPADELMPLQCQPRPLSKERGTLDDVLSNMSTTLIDSLDTFAVMGDIPGFRCAVSRVVNEVSVDSDIYASVFELNIRILGGLLSAHMLSVDKSLGIWDPKFKDSYGISKYCANYPVLTEYSGELLSMAEDLGNRLLRSFDSPTGMPFHRINLRTCQVDLTSSESCSAAIGTFIVEFGTLSRLLNNPIYENAAKRAIGMLWLRRSPVGLFGNIIDVQDGGWRSSHSSIGAGIDSFLEYLSKSAVLLDDSNLYGMSRLSQDSVEENVLIPDANVHIDVSQDEGRINPRPPVITSMQSFYPSIEVLDGRLSAARAHLRPLLSLWSRFRSFPEVFDAFSGAPSPFGASSPLRPELIESVFHLYTATRDPSLLLFSASFLSSLNGDMRTRCGFAAVADCSGESASAGSAFRLDDRLDSFFLAETAKYLFLVFNHALMHFYAGPVGAPSDTVKKFRKESIPGHLFKNFVIPDLFNDTIKKPLEEHGLFSMDASAQSKYMDSKGFAGVNGTICEPELNLRNHKSTHTQRYAHHFLWYRYTPSRHFSGVRDPNHPQSHSNTNSRSSHNNRNDNVEGKFSEHFPEYLPCGSIPFLPMDLENYVFTTEGHVFPIDIARNNVNYGYYQNTSTLGTNFTGYYLKRHKQYRSGILPPFPPVSSEIWDAAVVSMRNNFLLKYNIPFDSLNGTNNESKIGDENSFPQCLVSDANSAVMLTGNYMSFMTETGVLENDQTYSLLPLSNSLKSAFLPKKNHVIDLSNAAGASHALNTLSAVPIYLQDSLRQLLSDSTSSPSSSQKSVGLPNRADLAVYPFSGSADFHGAALVSSLGQTLQTLKEYFIHASNERNKVAQEIVRAKLKSAAQQSANSQQQQGQSVISMNPFLVYPVHRSVGQLVLPTQKIAPFERIGNDPANNLPQFKKQSQYEPVIDRFGSVVAASVVISEGYVADPNLLTGIMQILHIGGRNCRTSFFSQKLMCVDGSLLFEDQIMEINNSQENDNDIIRDDTAQDHSLDVNESGERPNKKGPKPLSEEEKRRLSKRKNKEIPDVKSKISHTQLSPSGHDRPEIPFSYEFNPMTPLVPLGVWIGRPRLQVKLLLDAIYRTPLISRDISVLFLTCGEEKAFQPAFIPQSVSTSLKNVQSIPTSENESVFCMLHMAPSGLPDPMMSLSIRIRAVNASAYADFTAIDDNLNSLLRQKNSEVLEKIAVSVERMSRLIRSQPTSPFSERAAALRFVKSIIDYVKEDSKGELVERIRFVDELRLCSSIGDVVQLVQRFVHYSDNLLYQLQKNNIDNTLKVFLEAVPRNDFFCTPGQLERSILTEPEADAISPPSTRSNAYNKLDNPFNFLNKLFFARTPVARFGPQFDANGSGEMEVGLMLPLDGCRAESLLFHGIPYNPTAENSENGKRKDYSSSSARPSRFVAVAVRGGCTFVEKSLNAAKMGASALLVLDLGTPEIPDAKFTHADYPRSFSSNSKAEPVPNAKLDDLHVDSLNIVDRYPHLSMTDDGRGVSVTIPSTMFGGPKARALFDSMGIQSPLCRDPRLPSYVHALCSWSSVLHWSDATKASISMASDVSIQLGLESMDLVVTKQTEDNELLENKGFFDTTSTRNRKDNFAVSSLEFAQSLVNSLVKCGEDCSEDDIPHIKDPNTIYVKIE